MRRSPIPLTIMLLSIGALGCGGAASRPRASGAVSPASRTTTAASRTTTAASRTTTASSRLDSDRDPDANNDEGILGNGRAADGGELHAIATAVHDYYAAAAAEDGGRACQLMSLRFAKSVPIDYGRFGAPYMHGSTCPVVMRRLFAHEHSQLSAEASTLRVREARLEGDHGFVLLHSRPLAVSKIRLRREGRSWKIESLVADE